MTYRAALIEREAIAAYLDLIGQKWIGDNIRAGVHHQEFVVIPSPFGAGGPETVEEIAAANEAFYAEHGALTPHEVAMAIRAAMKVKRKPKKQEDGA